MRCVRFQSLPWQTPLEEVDEHVGDGLEVVASALLEAAVVVDGGVARGAYQRATVSGRDMLQSGGIAITLCETKINAIYNIFCFTNTNTEVRRFDVSMHEMTGMKSVDAIQQLISQK